MRNVARGSLVDAAIAELRGEIGAGRWAVGERIPSEAQLAETLGMSRLSVREAVRALVHAGLLTTRQGSGTYVTATDESDAALGRVLDGVASRDIAEVRLGLDLLAARLAASRRTDADLADLREIAARRRAAFEAGELEAFADADVAFHLRIAQASHNRLLTDLYRNLCEGLREVVLADHMQHSTTTAHADLLRALTDGDPAAAAAAALTIVEA
ncbi:FadR/GntR family transcriptional regulator [Streptacidiphilus jiangxiensis]|uniref:DNA-binding transcriptional regulator, FadR family n=1 Tax=Streptacidiphilus jiangxiensis TaxID=235985 RepID=A0A1H7XBT6_STRJI|nr:FCD domain-containing protein [Streptacidiphilus jiangxiensis]SEM31143.1 DNA-binding transcriptional regulator, FadR family [Streptacidiphilus jiangxiensis]